MDNVLLRVILELRKDNWSATSKFIGRHYKAQDISLRDRSFRARSVSDGVRRDPSLTLRALIRASLRHRVTAKRGTTGSMVLRFRLSPIGPLARARNRRLPTAGCASLANH